MLRSPNQSTRADLSSTDLCQRPEWTVAQIKDSGCKNNQKPGPADGQSNSPKLATDRFLEAS